MTQEPQEQSLEGIGVSPGIAFGRIAPIWSGSWSISTQTLDPESIPDEVDRFDRAVRKSRRQVLALKRIRARLTDAAADELSEILEAHATMLGNSRLVRGARTRIEAEHIDAASATQTESDAIASGFAALDNAYLAARAQDIREVAERILRNLAHAPKNPFAAAPKGSILFAENITPADTAMMDPERIEGFVSLQGGTQGHTAILARSLGIPAVMGLGPNVHFPPAGAPIILDGDSGRLILNPKPTTEQRYRELRLKQQRDAAALRQLIGRPALTRDGVEIQLGANLELPVETKIAITNGADGVGLFRTEFLFMNRTAPPSEDEQYETLAAVVKAMDGKPVTIRTMDVGGEKVSYALGNDLEPSPNPALGLRAIRLSLRRPKLLETQLQAILRASVHGPVRILIPMITTPGEIRAVRETLTKVARRLKRKGIPLASDLPPLGIMIEVPGAALSADTLARSCDFFAIGTNDLTQYTLAIDRTDDQVAHLYNPLHPGVLRLIEFSVQAALRARIPVSICGEMAADPRYTALLLGLGVRELSMAGTALLRVKQRLLTLDLAAAEARARMVMESADPGRIRILIDDLNGLAG